MNKREALVLLKKERDYEDELMKDLSGAFLSSLKKIEDLDEKEMEEVEAKLTIILDESEGHKNAFESLMKMVEEEDGTNNY